MYPQTSTTVHTPEYSDELPTYVPLQDAQGQGKEVRRSSLEQVDIPLESNSTRPFMMGGRFSALRRVISSGYFPVSALVPSFLQRKTDISSRRLHPSAWLGMVNTIERGIISAMGHERLTIYQMACVASQLSLSSVTMPASCGSHGTYTEAGPRAWDSPGSTNSSSYQSSDSSYQALPKSPSSSWYPGMRSRISL